MKLFILIFTVFIPIIIIGTIIFMSIIINKSIKYRKEQEELYLKKKYIIEKQYEELKNKEH